MKLIKTATTEQIYNRLEKSFVEKMALQFEFYLAASNRDTPEKPLTERMQEALESVWFKLSIEERGDLIKASGAEETGPMFRLLFTYVDVIHRLCDHHKELNRGGADE